MIKKWSWAVWITAVLGIFVFLVAAAAFAGWSGRDPGYNPVITKAAEILSGTSRIAALAKNLKEQTGSGVSLKILRKETSSLLKVATGLVYSLGKLQVKAGKESFQTKGISSSLGDVARALDSYRKLIEKTESSTSGFEENSETALNVIRILLYNLALKGKSVIGIRNEAGIFRNEARTFRKKALEYLLRAEGSAERSVREAGNYQRKTIASFHKDNRITLLGIVFFAFLFWIMLSIITVKILAGLLMADPVSHGLLDLKLKNKTVKKNPHKTL